MGSDFSTSMSKGLESQGPASDQGDAFQSRLETASRKFTGPGSLMCSMETTEPNMSIATDQISVMNEPEPENKSRASDKRPAGRADERIKKRLQSYNQSNPEMSEAENRLAAEDPLTLAFLNELEVDPDPEKAENSATERRLAGRAPLTFGLLRYNGFKINTDRFGAALVTKNGQTLTLTPQQQKLFASGNLAAFADSLLAKTPPDENVRQLATATSVARIEYSRTRVNELMGQQKEKEALQTLKTNMNAAFSVPEHDEIWKQAGKEQFTAGYFRDRIGAIRKSGFDDNDAMLRVGKWMQETAGSAPEEAAGLVLDVVQSEFNGDWINGRTTVRGGTLGVSDGKALYRGISALSEAAPNHASETAAWMTTRNQNGRLLLDRLARNDFDAIVDTAKEGHGVRLAQEINNKLQTQAKESPGKTGLFGFRSSSAAEDIAESFSERFTEAREEAGRHYYADVVAARYEAFSLNPDREPHEILDSLVDARGVGKAVRVGNETELRNIVGRAMGFVPDDHSSAEAGDYDRDWYTAGTGQRKQIDQITGWINSEGGTTGSSRELRARPFVYASPIAGVSKGALFEITGDNGETVVIDGSAADDVLARNGGKPVAPGEDTDMPWKYESVENFFDDNQLDPNGRIYMADGRGQGGRARIKNVAAANVTTGEAVIPWVDVGVGVVGVAGGILLAIPSGGSSLALTAGGWALAGGAMAYGAYRSGEELSGMSDHGQDVWTLSNPQARGAWFGLATVPLTALGGGAALRAAATAGKTAQIWNLTSKGAGAMDMALGVEQMGEGGYMLATEWDNMDAEQRSLSILNVGVGAAGFGAGAFLARGARSANAEAPGINPVDAGTASKNLPGQLLMRRQQEETGTVLSDADATAYESAPARFTEPAGTGDEARYSLPGFESAAVRAVENTEWTRARPDQWAGLLKKHEKPDLLAWTGVEEWLGEQTGQVSKPDLLAWLKAHEIELDERVFSRTAPEHTVRLTDASGAFPLTQDEIDRNIVRAWQFDVDVDGVVFTEKMLEEQEGRRTRTYRIVEKASGEFNITDVHGNIIHKNLASLVDAQETIRRDTSRFVKASYYPRLPVLVVGGADGMAGSNYRELLIRFPQLEGKYKSKIFGDQEIAYVRFDERTDAAGRKVLFLNMIQSDLHQNPSAKNHPDAPFRGNLWLELVMKRMLQYASENNFDAISWASREQVADVLLTKPEKIPHLYDDRVPRFLNRYTKKWGGEVETTTGINGSPDTNQILYLTPQMRNIGTQTYRVGPAGPEGRYARGLIEVSRSAFDPMGIVRHETIHALRDMGVFTDKEWSTLTQAAEQGGWLEKHGIQEKYEDLYRGKYGEEGARAAMMEEAIADEFMQWRDRGTSATPEVGTLFQKLRDWFTKLKNNLFNEGIQSADDVFRRIESGEAGSRPVSGAVRGQGTGHIADDFPPHIAGFARRVLPEGVDLTAVDRIDIAGDGRLARSQNRSSAIRLVGEHPIELMRPDTWISLLESSVNKNRIHSSELEYTGVIAWLREQRNKLGRRGTLHRNDVLEFMRQHSIAMREDLLTDVSGRSSNEIKLQRLTGASALTPDELGIYRSVREYSTGSEGLYRVLQVSDNDFVVVHRNYTSGGASYAGEIGIAKSFREAEDLIRKHHIAAQNLTQTNNLFRGGSEYSELSHWILAYEGIDKTGRLSDPRLFSIRFDTRQVNNKKVLFIHDIQTDHPQRIKEDIHSIRQINDEFYRFRTRRDDLTTAYEYASNAQKIAIGRLLGQVTEQYENVNQARLKMLKEHSADAQSQYALYDTDFRFEQAVRSIMRYASEHGFDAVSWATAEQIENALYARGRQDPGPAFDYDRQIGVALNRFAPGTNSKLPWERGLIDRNSRNRILYLTPELHKAARQPGSDLLPVSRINPVQESPVSLPDFESAAIRAVEDRGQPKATPQQWRMLLDRSPGVRKDELNWMGVGAWLDQQEQTIGVNGTISREDLLGYMRLHQIRLDEKIYGGRDLDISLKDVSASHPVTQDEVLTHGGVRAYQFEVENVGPYRIVEKSGTGEFKVFKQEKATGEFIPFAITRNLEHAKDFVRVNAERVLSGANAHRFKEYRVPHGKNYTELLLRLPELAQENYRSENFRDQEIVYIRFDERTDLSGNRVLFINEIQSDIHKGTSRQARPDAPFAGDLWLQLALKRMIKYAADNGFDAVSWARADQIAKVHNIDPASLALEYDRKIPRFLDSYTKAWDGKLETAMVVSGDTGPNQIIYLTPEMRSIGTQAYHLSEGTPQGRYNRGLIEVSRSALDPMQTVRHETIHALRDVGAFTETEWSTLVKAAEDGSWLEKHKIREKYEDLYRTRYGDDGAIKAMVEEAIADEFMQWRNHGARVTPEVRSLFQRIRDWLTKLRNNLFNEGIHSADDVFRRIESGEVGSRHANRESAVQTDRSGITEFPEDVRAFAERVLPRDIDIRAVDRITATEEGLFALPGFESRPIEVMQQANNSRRSATAAEWRHTFDRWSAKHGFTRDEIEWMGIYDFLDAHEQAFNAQQTRRLAGERIDAESEIQENIKGHELLEVMLRNHIEVDERILDKPGPDVRIIDVTDQRPAEKLRNPAIMEVRQYEVEGVGDYISLLHINGDHLVYLGKQEIARVTNPEEVTHRIHAHAMKLLASPDDVKFRRLAIQPEGENYRELLIRVPEFIHNHSPHYGDKEVVHIRFDERRDATGNKVLFIHEIQSDNHQRGSRFGYRNTTDWRRYREISESSPRTIIAYEKLRQVILTSYTGQVENVKQQIFLLLRRDGLEASSLKSVDAIYSYMIDQESGLGNYLHRPMNETEYLPILNQIGMARAEDIVLSANAINGSFQKIKRDVNAVLNDFRAQGVNEDDILSVYRYHHPGGDPAHMLHPYAAASPFKGDQWINIALKRMLKYASDNGFAAVSWARSDQIEKAVGSLPGSLRMEYDQKIPGFMRRFARRNGGEITEAGIIDRENNSILYLNDEMRSAVTTQYYHLDDDGAAQGGYRPGFMEISRSALDPMQTVRHETVHALRDMGLFSETEWRALEQAANKGGWLEKHGIREKYEELYRETQPGKDLNDLMLEEAIADEFARWRNGKAELPPGIRRVFQKILDFLTSLRNNLFNEGIHSADDVFRRIESGEIGSRPVSDQAYSPAAREGLDEFSDDITAFIRRVLPNEVDIALVDRIETGDGALLALSPSQLARAKVMYQGGETITDIAAKLGVNYFSLRRKLIQEGIHKSSGITIREPLDSGKITKAMKLYESGSSIEEIADHLNVLQSELRDLLIGKGKPVTDEILREAIVMYKTGKKIKKIADSLGVNSDALYLRLIEENIHIPKSRISNKELVRAKRMLGAGRSIADISHTLRVNERDLRSALAKTQPSPKPEPLLGPDKIAEAAKMMLDGIPMQRIAERFGVGAGTLRKKLIEAGLHSPVQKRQTDFIDASKVEQATVLYHGGTAPEDIADILNVDPGFLRTRLIRAGVLSHGHKGRGKVINADMLEKARQMYQRGKNISEIARELGVNSETVRISFIDEGILKVR